MDTKMKQSGSKFKILGMSGAMGFISGEPIKRRKRIFKTRNLSTYNRKLSRIKSLYKRLVNQSIKSKDVFNKLTEKEQLATLKRRSQNRDSVKAFFCDKYPTFEGFLLKIPVKQVERQETKSSTSSFVRPKRVLGGRNK